MFYFGLGVEQDFNDDDEDKYMEAYFKQKAELSKDFKSVESQYQKELKEISDKVNRGELDIWSRDFINEHNVLESKYAAYLDSLKTPEEITTILERRQKHLNKNTGTSKGALYFKHQ